MNSSDRFQRHELIDWFDQEKVSSIRALVIGAGAIGNELIKNLVLLGIRNIDLFDFDTIEIHNLTRSVLFREDDIGQPKAVVAARRAHEIDPNCTIVPHVKDFWDGLSLVETEKFDVVFCCVDNFEARIRCNLMCRLAGTVLINAGIDSRFCSVELYPFGPDKQVGCYECALPHSVYSRISERYSCGSLRKTAFIEAKVPTTIITSSTAAALATSIGVRAILNKENDHSFRVLVDTISGNSTKSLISENGDCGCCAQLKKPIVVASCNDFVESDFPAELDSEIEVTASDPILIGYKIGDQWTRVLKRASDFDDSFAASVSDDPESVLLDIRDQFNLDEILHLFGGTSLPCKFASISTQKNIYVFEFEQKA